MGVATMMATRHDSHVNAWVKQHARQLSRKAIADGFKPQALHEYTDCNDNPTHWRIRLKHPETGGKWIRPLMRTGAVFELKQPEYPNGTPLYRLHELAANPHEPVLIVEGETCADALAKMGIISTTSGAADSAAKADWSILSGRAVAIWPDNDEAGQRYAESVKLALEDIGCTVSTIDVAALDLPPKGDCVDWLKAHPGATAGDVHALMKIDTSESAESDDQGTAEAKPYPLHGASRYASEVSIIRGCDLTPEAIKWLWPGWLAAGKLHILGGAPGTGKTTLALAMAATITTGGRWPDGTRAALGNVVIWSGEDDPTDTLLPRLILSSADVNRIYFVGDVLDAEGKRTFDPAKDMRPLSDALDGIGDVRLLIVDPIVSAVAGDSHKNAEVRRALAPLVDLAGRMGCALVGVTHFSKGTAGRDPTERITGSLAFGALARLVMVAAKHQDQGDESEARRVLLRAKSNIGADDGGFFYELRQGELTGHPGIFASSVLWGEAVEGTARDLLATADSTGDDGDGGTLGDAERFLSDLLADGPLPTKAIKADADGAGYSWATIRRAQKALGIEPVKEGGRFGATKQQWLWRLPAEPAQRVHLQDESLKMLKNTEDAQQKEVSTFREIEHLQEKSGVVEVEI